MIGAHYPYESDIKSQFVLKQETIVWTNRLENYAHVVKTIIKQFGHGCGCYGEMCIPS